MAMQLCNGQVVAIRLIAAHAYTVTKAPVADLESEGGTRVGYIQAR